MMNILPLAAAAADAADTATKAGLTGSLALGFAGMGAAIGIGLIGAKAVEAVGRNPGAFGKVLPLAILGMALAEAIAIYALIMNLLGR
jgi:F-type H+-transporting ATPase subunit c